MIIHLASDHAGFELKNELKLYLESLGHECKDSGPHHFDEKDDYPDFIFPAAEKVSESWNNVGIVIGGSGQGEAIAANKVPGIRAALYYGGPHEILQLSRSHNDANILALGARFLSVEEAKAAVVIWLESKFSKEERHVRRLEKIESYED